MEYVTWDQLLQVIQLMISAAILVHTLSKKK